jgi:predicted dinucleotide-binding enzyme
MKKMVKKTIAIIGDTGKFCPALTKAAVQQDLRLLFISHNEEVVSKVKAQLEELKKPTEVEFISCEKEGCWEAEIIAFTRPEEIEPVLFERIRQVSTQKTVVVISHRPVKTSEHEKFCFQELLPHSRLVELEIKGSEFRIFGRNSEANQYVQEFFEAAGYQQK